MNKTIIDPRKLCYLVDVGWMSDAARQKLYRLDCATESEIREAMRKYLIPHLEEGAYWPQRRETLKLHLSYYLTKGVIPVKTIVNSCEYLFDESIEDRPVEYFQWVWDELFPGEDYHLDSLSVFIEDTSSHSF